MTSHQVLRLVRLMPANCPYLRTLPQASNARLGSLVDRLAFCTQDADFGFRFVQAHHDTGVPMDPAVHEESLLLLHRHYTKTCTPEQEWLLARTLNIEHPESPTLRNLVQVHLLDGRLNYHEIGRRLKLPVAAVRLYEELFFNVRDRLDDPAFIHRLLFPETRLVTMRPGYAEMEEPRLIMLRLAYDHDLDSALALSGGRSIFNREHDGGDAASRAEAFVYNQTLLQLRVGVDRHRVISHARSISTAAKIGGQDQNTGGDGRRTGLEAIHNRFAVSDEIKAYNSPDTRARLLVDSFSEMARQNPDTVLLQPRGSSKKLPAPQESPDLIARLRSAGTKKEVPPAKAPPG